MTTERPLPDPEPIPPIERLERPVPFVDDVLGRVRWNEDNGQFECHVEAGGEPVAVMLATDSRLRVEAALARARRVAPDLEGYLARAKQHAAAGLLALKNDAWSDEGDDPVTVSD